MTGVIRSRRKKRGIHTVITLNAVLFCNNNKKTPLQMPATSVSPESTSRRRQGNGSAPPPAAKKPRLSQEERVQNDLARLEEVGNTAEEEEDMQMSKTEREAALRRVNLSTTTTENEMALKAVTLSKKQWFSRGADTTDQRCLVLIEPQTCFACGICHRTGLTSFKHFASLDSGKGGKIQCDMDMCFRCAEGFIVLYYIELAEWKRGERAEKPEPRYLTTDAWKQMKDDGMAADIYLIRLQAEDWIPSQPLLDPNAKRGFLGKPKKGRTMTVCDYFDELDDRLKVLKTEYYVDEPEKFDRLIKEDPFYFSAHCFNERQDLHKKALVIAARREMEAESEEKHAEVIRNLRKDFRSQLKKEKQLAHDKGYDTGYILGKAAANGETLEASAQDGPIAAAKKELEKEHAEKIRLLKREVTYANGAYEKLHKKVINMLEQWKREKTFALETIAGYMKYFGFEINEEEAERDEV